MICLKHADLITGRTGTEAFPPSPDDVNRHGSQLDRHIVRVSCSYALLICAAHNMSIFRFTSKEVRNGTRESSIRFENQIALVTGAASGIGRALVQRFVAEGAAVVAVDITEGALQQVVAELQAQGGKATACVANVSSDAVQNASYTPASGRRPPGFPGDHCDSRSHTPAYYAQILPNLRVNCHAGTESEKAGGRAWGKKRSKRNRPDAFGSEMADYTKNITYQLSMNGRRFPSLGMGIGTERSPCIIQRRVSRGSITSSISR